MQVFQRYTIIPCLLDYESCFDIYLGIVSWYGKKLLVIISVLTFTFLLSDSFSLNEFDGFKILTVFNDVISVWNTGVWSLININAIINGFFQSVPKNIVRRLSTNLAVCLQDLRNDLLPRVSASKKIYLHSVKKVKTRLANFFWIFLSDMNYSVVSIMNFV